MVNKCTAILLAAGAGRRMQSGVAKQYMMLLDRPVIYYSLQALERSPLIDDIILVVGKGEISYMKEQILDRYGFTKVSTVTEGGAERFLSVQNALKVLADREGYVLIHDGARPFVTETIIADTIRAAVRYGACCAAMPVKDTIKVADENGFAVQTPDRSTLYAVQTPQTFAADIILEAHRKLNEKRKEPGGKDIPVTDDAMVVETMLGRPVKLVEASYENIKITTPEDMTVAEGILVKRMQNDEKKQ
ncbi:MAG: 2-C-methyl-D-erythritol 4-phosphate cytidylyltransferase [Lachnospiraceae bacterium]|nr:2-C-methyl-D-erythritol 4-phosphate cytidylyltransferase [Lachnospiraceae bacterium]